MLEKYQIYNGKKHIDKCVKQQHMVTYNSGIQDPPLNFQPFVLVIEVDSKKCNLFIRTEVSRLA